MVSFVACRVLPHPWAAVHLHPVHLQCTPGVTQVPCQSSVVPAVSHLTQHRHHSQPTLLLACCAAECRSSSRSATVRNSTCSASSTLQLPWSAGRRSRRCRASWRPQSSGRGWARPSASCWMCLRRRQGSGLLCRVGLGSFLVWFGLEITQRAVSSPLLKEGCAQLM